MPSLVLSVYLNSKNYILIWSNKKKHRTFQMEQQQCRFNISVLPRTQETNHSFPPCCLKRNTLPVKSNRFLRPGFDWSTVRRCVYTQITVLTLESCFNHTSTFSLAMISATMQLHVDNFQVIWWKCYHKLSSVFPCHRIDLGVSTKGYTLQRYKLLFN